MALAALSFIAVTGSGAAASAEGGAPLLIGMGDSYTAGIGIPPLDPTSELCERSLAAYPMLAATQLGYDGRSVACGGADLADLTSESRRGSPPQIADIAAADVVAMTVGGSDVYGPYGLIYAGTSAAGAASYAAHIEELRPQLLSTFTAVRQAAPQATVYVLSYPDVLPPSQTAFLECWGPLGNVLDATAMHQALSLLNAAIADTAVAAGVTLLDTTALFAGHEMCSADPYANSAGDPSPEYPGPGMHPNAHGHQVLAAALADTVRRSEQAGPTPTDPSGTTSPGTTAPATSAPGSSAAGTSAPGAPAPGAFPTGVRSPVGGGPAIPAPGPAPAGGGDVAPGALPADAAAASAVSNGGPLAVDAAGGLTPASAGSPLPSFPYGPVLAVFFVLFVAVLLAGRRPAAGARGPVVPLSDEGPTRLRP